MTKFLVLAFAAAFQMSAQPRFDLVVYGATPAGVASAVVAARQGHRVALIEPSPHVGGLLTGGLSYTDFHTQEAVTGFFREYMDHVLAHYTKSYGADSQQVRDSFGGALAEPHVSSQILQNLLSSEKTIQVMTQTRLINVFTASGAVGKNRITGAQFLSTEGSKQLSASFWIDATYEGDLAAAARVAYRLGRESTSQYGEHFAGVLFFDGGQIMPGSTGEADDSVQCSNYRIVMTDDPKLRLEVQRPASYRRDEFTRLLPWLTSGKIKEVYSEDKSGILRLQRLPNRKSDMNDIKQAPIRLALPGENQKWPEGDWSTRQAIAQRHLDYDIGLLYFLRNDPEVPLTIRNKAAQWGLARDEFTGNAHLPTALYVREGRRIEGEYTFTERDTQPARNSVRSPLHHDSIAVGDYSLNSHGHHRQGPLYPTLVEGDFSSSTVPFQIPFGVMVPKGIDNLLVPVAVSASHVGYSALRLEPTWTSLGHAAGLAAHLTLSSKFSVPALQRLLHAQGQATIYVSDVPPHHPQFAAVQWAGSHGLFDDVQPYQSAQLEPRRLRFGSQYFYASTTFRANLDVALDGRLTAAWGRRLPCAANVQAVNRGTYIEKAYALCNER